MNEQPWPGNESLPLSMANRLEPSEAARHVDAMMAVIVKMPSNSPGSKPEWAAALVALADRLSPDDAAARCAAAAHTLVQAMTQATGDYELACLGSSLVVVAARLKPDEAGAPLCGRCPNPYPGHSQASGSVLGHCQDR